MRQYLYLAAAIAAAAYHASTGSFGWAAVIVVCVSLYPVARYLVAHGWPGAGPEAPARTETAARPAQ